MPVAYDIYLLVKTMLIHTTSIHACLHRKHKWLQVHLRIETCGVYNIYINPQDGVMFDHILHMLGWHSKLSE